MSTYSTFGTFTLARMGIYVSQQALNVTGNNIANINTDGYTREKLDQSSMNFGAADRYITKYSIRQNGGVLADGVNQLRDQYLDIRYRNESTKVGEMDAKLSGLQQLAEIFDEVAKGEDGEGVLEARFNDFIQQLENLSQPGNVGSDSADGLVRQAAEAITVQFNNYAKKLDTLQETLTTEFKDNIDAVNATLVKIRDLNTSIRTAEIFGDSALTQRDQRNMLIDELSKQIGINVTYEAEELSDGLQAEKLVISTESGSKLIDGIYGAQITLLNETNFDLGISVLTDKNGRPEASQPNAREDTVVGFRTVALNNQEEAAVFGSQSEAEAAAKLLNGDSAYSQDILDATKAYYYQAKQEPSESGQWYIRRYTMNYEDYAAAKTAGTLSSVGTQDDYVYTAFTVEQLTKLDDNDLSGGLQAMREILTEEGEYASAEDLERDPNAGIKRGIPYYRQALDTLAREFAKAMNEANNRSALVYKTADHDRVKYFDQDTEVDITDKTPEEIAGYTKKYYDAEWKETTDPNQYKIYLDENGNDVSDDPSKYVLKDEYSYYNGGTLFTNKGDSSGTTENITAANISVAYDWSHGKTRVLRSIEPDAPSLKQDNIDHMISLMTSSHKFEFGTASEGTTYFEGTFQDMLTDSIAGNLAKDQNITKSMLNNYTATADEIYNSRDSVMGVDLNDEAMNMMMFQKAYAAACRLMTTYDGLLDKLINGTAV